MKLAISEILKRNSLLISEYIQNMTKIAVILIDRDRIIHDCNQGFIESIGLKEKPLKNNIRDFLLSNSKDFSLPDKNGFLPCNLNFVTLDNAHIALSGHILAVQDGYFILLEKHRLTYNELLKKMSFMNNKLGNLVRELDKKNQELKKANTTIKRIMNTDPLTQLINRRALKEQLLRGMALSRRYKLPLSLIMTDIDHFKSINDTYGHEAGDRVLKCFAKILKKSSRSVDTVARIGGEEFLILLPNTDKESALQFAERLRRKIEIATMPGLPIKITSSFGVAEFIASDTQKSFIKRADDALYAAKRSGRNCCVISQI